MVIRIDPDPYSHISLRNEENAIHTMTIEAYYKGKEQDRYITMEQVKQFCQNYDSATRTVAKVILALSEKPIQVRTAECDEAFGIMADWKIAGRDEGMTRDEARQLCKLEWYRGKTPEEIVTFQLFRPHICTSFRKYRKAMEAVLGRPIQIQEFKNLNLLREEYRKGWRDQPLPQRKNTGKRKKNQRCSER